MKSSAAFATSASSCSPLRSRPRCTSSRPPATETPRTSPTPGVPFYVYYMAGMIAWGSMSAVLAGGARIAAERSVGWVRQLRISPLSTRVYFTTKVVTGYLVAGLTILALAIAGTAFGVRLPWDGWVRMIAARPRRRSCPLRRIGIWLGHVLTIDSMGPALGGTTAVFALLGGAFGPLGAQDGCVPRPESSCCRRTGSCRPGTRRSPVSGGRSRPGSCWSSGPRCSYAWRGGPISTTRSASEASGRMQP